MLSEQRSETKTNLKQQVLFFSSSLDESAILVYVLITRVSPIEKLKS